MKKPFISLILLALICAGCQDFPTTPFPPSGGGSAGNACDCSSIACVPSCCPNCPSVALASITDAKSSVRVAIGAPLTPNLIAALKDAQARGVQVSVVADARQAAVLPKLTGSGIRVKTHSGEAFPNILVIDNVQSHIGLPAAAPAAGFAARTTTPDSVPILYTRQGARQTVENIEKWQTLWDTATDSNAPTGPLSH